VDGHGNQFDDRDAIAPGLTGVDAAVALLLAQDGITNGAIYALLSLALVLVFAVTRVIYIPQGEFVAYGALSMAAINAGALPPTMWLVVTLGIAVAIVDSVAAIREGAKSRLPVIILKNAVLPILAVIVVRYLPLKDLAYPVQILIALGFVVPLGPQIYRLAFQPVAEASVLLLLIVAVAVHFVLVGMGLYFFGAEGARIPAFTDGGVTLGPAYVQYQTIWIVGIAAVLIAGLALFFEHSIYGKALRATAINRTGARLMGISADLAGQALLHAVGAGRRLLRHTDRADHHDLLRHRIPDRPQGLRRRHHRRPRLLSAGGGRRNSGRPAGILFLLLRLGLQGSHRVHPDHSGAALPVADHASRRRRGGPLTWPRCSPPIAPCSPSCSR
jgi:branched-chain amino acid transport system permease protein